MKVLSDLNKSERRLLENIKNGELIHASVTAGSDSDPEDLEATYEILQMDKRSLHLQMNFKKPLYVSSAGEPDYLEVVFQDVEHFCSEEFLPLKTKNDDKTLFLTKKLP